MKTLLNYKYNLFPNKIMKVKNGYYFFINEIKYYIVKLNRPVEDIMLLVSVNEKLEKLSYCVYKIIPNTKNEYYFNYENNNYIIFKVLRNEKEIIDLIDLIKINNLIKTKHKTLLNRNDWKKLWSEKIDYFEYSMTLIGENNKLINGSFSYYIGLAENAISYYNDTLLEEKTEFNELYMSHKRIHTPTLSCKVFNPLNFIFDYKVRDVSEYIKTKFFNNILDWDEIELLFKTNYFSRSDFRLLFARLLFPSYYFDAYTKYQETRDETVLKKIVTKTKEYEDFLFDIFILIKKYYYIPEVEWLMKKNKL